MDGIVLAALAVAGGGFVGGCARFALTRALPPYVAVLAANIVGSLLLGIGVGAPGILPLLLAVGVGGGMSTWSTFAVQMAQLVEKRQWPRLAKYLAATVALCVVAAWRGSIWGARIFANWQFG